MIHKYLHFFLVIFLVSCLNSRLSANHMMGADLSYTHISGTTYQIKLQFYRDCDGAQAPNNAQFSIRSASCGINTTVTANQVYDQEVSAVCAAQLQNTTCNSNNGTQPGVQRYYYTANYTLPQNCTDWIFSWRGWRRNATITTGPAYDTLYIEARLNSIIAPGNSSPTFSSLPVPYFCANQPATFNHGASDINGDYFVYSMVNPMQSASTYVNFNLVNPLVPGVFFSGSYPIKTLPAFNFGFNPATGQMTFTSDGIQQGVTALRVDEYRNGVWIGSVMRDIQLIVIDCGNNQPVTISPISNIAGANSLGNNTFQVCAGTHMSFTLTGTDPNAGTNIGMTANVGALSGATFTTTGTNPKTGTFNWTPPASAVGFKNFTVTITDNSCPIPSVQVIGFSINIVKVDLSAPDFTICPGVTSTIQLNASASGGLGCASGNCYSWSPTTGLSATTIANPSATVSNPINYVVSYNDGVCLVKDSVHIYPVGSVTISPQDTLACIGKNVVLNAPNTFPTSQNPTCAFNNVPCTSSLSVIQIDTMHTNTNVTGTNLGIGSPYQGAYHDGRIQYLYPKSELQLWGVSAGLLHSIAFNITHKLSLYGYKDFTIKIGCTSLSQFSSTSGFVPTNMTTVYSGIIQPLLGWNVYNFTAPYEWDGQSNLIIEVCFDNTNASYYDHVEYSNTSYNSVLYSRLNSSSGCTLTSPTASTRRPNIQLSNCDIASPVTYTWTTIFGNGISSMSSTTSSAPSVHPSDTTIYVVAVSNGSCIVKDTAIVYTKPVATLTTLQNYTTCPGDTVILSLVGNQYVSYISWTGGIINDTLIVAPLTTTTYTAIGHTNCSNLVRTSKITVVDSIAPTISNCPVNKILYNTATTCDVFYSWTQPTASDNCPRFSIAQTAGLTSGSAFPVGITTVTYDAQDLKGNHTLCNFNVTVKDTVKPIILGCPQNIVVNSNPNICKGTASWTPPTTIDNCPNPTIAQFGGLSSGSLFPVGVNTIKYRAIDASGNISYCIFTVTVLDVQAPTLVNMPADITVSNDANLCGATVSWVIPSSTDNCTGSSVAQTGGILNGGFFPFGTSTVTYTATDIGGNTTLDSFTVTVNDTQAPTFSTCMGDTTISTDLGLCSAVFSWNAPSAFDNCPGFVSINQVIGQNPGSSFGLGAHTIAYSATDILGNVDTCTFHFTVIDLEPPMLVNCPTNIFIPKDTNACGSTATWIPPTAIDNCAMDTVIQTGGILNGGFFPLGPTTITYTATDAAGNQSTCSFVVFITDASFPIINNCPSNFSVSNDAGVCGATISWTPPTVTDNCPGSTLTTNPPLANGTVFPIGTTTVVYTATDAALNVTTCSFTVTVTDTQFPVFSFCPQNISVGNDLGQCGATVNWATPIVVENCPNMTVTPNILPNTFFPIGTTNIVYTAVDSSGNTTTCNFSVTVSDTEAPTILNCPSNIIQSSTTTSCDAIVNWTEPIITDNCIGMHFISNYQPGDTFPSDTTVVTYTATDSVGNISICSFLVIINDSISPILSNCPSDIVVYADANCQAVANWTPPTPSDNCPNFYFTEYHHSGDTFQLGTTDVIYIVADGAGNTDSCVFKIIVKDTIPPVILNCPQSIVYNLTSRCDTNIVWTPPTVTDNCGAKILPNFQPNDVFPIGVTTVYYAAMDSSKNIDTCFFTVTINPPITLSVTNTVLSNIHCLNGNDGSISTSVTGGSGHYLYSWNTVPPQTTPTAVGLTVGTYTVYVSDSSAPACLTPTQATSTLIQLPVLDVFTSGMSPTCYGFSNGTIAAIASAGTPPYNYAWNYLSATSDIVTNVPAGLYFVTVTDAQNCTDTASILLPQPDSLSGLATQKNIDCKGNKTGIANILMSGGTPPYNYQWTGNSSLTNGIINVKANNYTVTVKDANNCVYSHTFTLTEPDSLKATTRITEIICHNSATGTATVNIQGGTPAYTVSWTSTPPQDSTTAINLPYGIYYAFVVDSQLCKTKAKAILTNPPYLMVSLMDTMPVYCNRNNGEITVTAKGGIPPYTFTWDTDPMQTGVIATALEEGTYSVMLTDARGCQDSLTQSLTNVPPAIPLFTSNPTFTSPILLSQAEQISFQNLSTGAVAYSWDFGDGQVSDVKNPKHSFFKTLIYTVTLTAYDPYYSCPTTFSADYEIIFDGAVFLPNAFTPNGDGINDFFGAYGDGLISVDLTVFDRWGKEIFHTNTIGDAWDGTKNGQSVPEGTYSYKLEAAFNDGKVIKRGGTVSVLR